MLYFIQAGNKIKIGKGMVASRLKNAKTWSPEKPQLLLALHVFNESEAEKKLHEHFHEHRLNGEWFQINFATAFAALLKLNLVPDVPQPILELPNVPPPPIHPDFRRWYIGVDWRIMDSRSDPYLPSPEQVQSDPEALRHIDENIEDLWMLHHRLFEDELKQHNGDIAAMIASRQLMSSDESFKELRAMMERDVRQ